MIWGLNSQEEISLEHNIIIQEFKNIVSAMDTISEEIHDLPGTYTFLALVVIRLAIHIISLKDGLLTFPRMRNGSESLYERIHSIEMVMIN